MTVHMGAENDREVLSRFGEGVVVVGTQVTDYWVRPPYEVKEEGEVIRTLTDYRAALALGALLEEYDDLNLQPGSDLVPVDIAVDGRPAIATYLRGVHEYSREEVAEMMDITPETVRKYISRFRPDRSN